MSQSLADSVPEKGVPWWRSLGPALITACVVLGPGSLLISSNVGADHGYQMLWLLVVTGILMFTYVSMSARIAVAGGATPCTLLAQQAGRPIAAIIGINLCLTCATFQFSNNIAFTAAAGALLPSIPSWLVLVVLNSIIILFLLTAKTIYKFLERLMKITVGVIVVCFVVNLVITKPDFWGIIKGLVPSIPEGVTLGVPKKIDGQIIDPMILFASLIGTTFSVAGAFYQGNLVREKGWGIKDYKRGIGDSLFGISILTGISAVIMITTATMVPGKPATDIGVLAKSLEPLLGNVAFIFFCIGLLAVSMNPFLINAMIGGSILADGLGKPAGLSSRWSRGFTIIVLIIGMVVAMLALKTGQKPINLIIFGQALTVLANPLMAVAILYLANNKAVMGNYKNSVLVNIFGFAGLLVVLLMALRVVVKIYLNLMS
ncbi:MAG: Nramp family divalent metal transporter [Sedimentisphaerales bacterium]|nr:Nramp family divalent metal transporter [Sedimentisphaerales bacterium]